MSQEHYRQGDVLLRPATIPTSATKAEGLILAHGEATGHSHTVVCEDLSEVGLYEAEGKLWLRCGLPAGVVHQEHAPLTIPAGEYEVVRQVEWTDSQEPIQVRD